jgi:hypothetical protein
MNKFFLSLLVMAALCLPFTVSAVEFSPGYTVAASGHQCDGCHTAENTGTLPTSSVTTGGKTGVALVSPTSKAEYSRVVAMAGGSPNGDGKNICMACSVPLEVSLVSERQPF